MFCTNCGKELDNNAKFCSNCGSPVQNEDVYSSESIIYNQHYETSYARDKRDYKVVTKVVICVLFALIMFWFTHDSSTDNVSNNTNDIAYADNDEQETVEQSTLTETDTISETEEMDSNLGNTDTVTVNDGSNTNQDYSDTSSVKTPDSVFEGYTVLEEDTVYEMYGVARLSLVNEFVLTLRIDNSTLGGPAASLHVGGVLTNLSSDELREDRDFPLPEIHYFSGNVYTSYVSTGIYRRGYSDYVSSYLLDFDYELDSFQTAVPTEVGFAFTIPEALLEDENAVLAVSFMLDGEGYVFYVDRPNHLSYAHD